MTPSDVEYKASERETETKNLPSPPDQKGVIQMKLSMRDMTGLTMGFLVVLIGGALRVMAYLPQGF